MQGQKVNVTIEANGFNLDIEIQKLATLKQLVLSMQQNYFLPANLDPSKMTYKDYENKTMNQSSKVENIPVQGDTIKLVITYNVDQPISNNDFIDTFEKIMNFISFGDIPSAKNQIGICKLDQVHQDMLLNLIQMIQMRIKAQLKNQNQIKLYKNGIQKVHNSRRSFNAQDYDSTQEAVQNVTGMIQHVVKLQDEKKKLVSQSKIMKQEQQNSKQKSKRQNDQKIKVANQKNRQLQQNNKQLKERINQYQKEIKKTKQVSKISQVNEQSINQKINNLRKINNNSLLNILNDINLIQNLFQILKDCTNGTNVSHINSIIKVNKNKRNHNIHQIIDGEQNILVLAQTKQNKIIGAFSSQPLSQSMKLGFGALMSMNEGQKINYFPILKNQKAMQYDLDYLIFGGQQLTISLSEMKMSSQINTFQNGHFLRCFDDPNNKRSKFLNNEDKTRSIGLNSYQILQVIFKK